MRSQNIFKYSENISILHNLILLQFCRYVKPGHIKKSDGPDPDPSPWLIVSDELKIKLKSKPYDPKKSCWVPDKATHGYWEGLIDSAEGDKVSVKILETGDVSNFIQIEDLKKNSCLVLTACYPIG